MSGGISTLRRASLCSVVMALTVFATGCVIGDGTTDGADEDTVETSADIVIDIPKPGGGLEAPKGLEGKNPVVTKLSGTAKMPMSKLDEVAEPEPEPWYPDGRGGSANPDDITVNTPSRTDDNK